MAETKKRLGKGLDALLSPSRIMEMPASESADTTTGEATSQPDVTTATSRDESASASTRSQLAVESLPVESILTNPYQPRQEWNQEGLEELAESIRKKGVLQPILVRQNGAKYQLIAGERRYRASQLAGLKAIPAIVRHANDEQMLEMALIENIQREDLNPIERAKAYKNYLDRFEFTQQEASERLGEDRSTLANYVRLLELPDEIKSFVADKRLTMGHCKAILGLPDAKARVKLATMAVTNELSVRKVEVLVKQWGRESSSDHQSSPASRPAHISELESEFSQALGTRVSIKTNGKKHHRGKLIIEFYSLDDFDRLREKLGAHN